MHELKKLPDSIAALTQELASLQSIMADAELYTKDPGTFDRTLRLLTRTQKKLEESEQRWLELESKESGA
jgi:ATP-binding cassette subfamily F protein uup